MSYHHEFIGISADYCVLEIIIECKTFIATDAPHGNSSFDGKGLNFIRVAAYSVEKYQKADVQSDILDEKVAPRILWIGVKVYLMKNQEQ